MARSRLQTLLTVALAVAVVVLAGIGLVGLGVFNSSAASRTTAKYPVAFAETGLPNDTAWAVVLGGVSESADAPSAIVFSSPEGSYPYSVVSVENYSSAPGTGSVTVGGSGVNVSVRFAQDSGPAIQHVVLIVLEDAGEEPGILSPPSYFSYLQATYGSAAQFYSVCHGSLPNYAAMTSGRYFACGSASINRTTVTNLPDLLQQAGDSWGAYFEGMPSPCDTNNSAVYHTDHNPFLLYQDIVGNSSRCNQHLLNSAAFNASALSGTLPTFSFYVPSIDNDCRAETSSLAECSAWLRGLLAPLLNSSSPTVQAEVAHTAFFITFDEGSTDDGYTVPGVVNPWCENQTGEPLSFCGGHVFMTVVSPYSIGTAYSGDATDYNLESTIEWLLGLGSDGGNDGTAAFPSMSSLFSFTSNG